MPSVWQPWNVTRSVAVTASSYAQIARNLAAQGEGVAARAEVAIHLLELGQGVLVTFFGEVGAGLHVAQGEEVRAGLGDQLAAFAAEFFLLWVAHRLDALEAELEAQPDDHQCGLPHQALAGALREQAEAMAQMITLEMGKPIAQARAEIEKCALLSEWYAAQGPAMLAPEPTLVDNGSAQIEYRPLGPILAVMPWNFPVWQVLRGAVPTLLAGNTYVLKHAPNVMGSAYLLLDVMQRAGFPEGVFELLNVTPDGVSRAIADRRIAAVTLTGSVRAGIAIGASVANSGVCLTVVSKTANSISSPQSSACTILALSSALTGIGRLSRMGVATSPGHTAVARMPWMHSSMFRLSVIALTPNLAAL